MNRFLRLILKKLHVHDANLYYYFLVFFIQVRPDYKEGVYYAILVRRWYKFLKTSESISM
jgi:hypothetical protein